MKPLKGIVSVFLFLMVICITCIIPAKMAYVSVSPDIIINSTGINRAGDQIIINYTLPNDFYSNSEVGEYLYIGFNYPAEFRGAFKNQYTAINQEEGTYSVLLPYTKGLTGNISIMAHYQAAWGRGLDEYIYKESYSISSNS